jgi:hypothetical protein
MTDSFEIVDINSAADAIADARSGYSAARKRTA